MQIRYGTKGLAHHIFNITILTVLTEPFRDPFVGFLKVLIWLILGACVPADYTPSVGETRFFQLAASLSAYFSNLFLFCMHSPPSPPHSSTSSSSTPPPLSFHSFLLCSFFYIPSSPYCQLLKIISSVYTFLLLPILSFFFHPTPYSSLSFLPSFVSYIHGRASRLSR